MDRGIVTPEAVVLDFETAGVASRLLAGLIDIAVQGVMVFGFLFLIFLVGQPLPALRGIAAAAIYVALFLVVFGYPAALETLWRGRTLGKAALGLRVVTAEGAPIQFRHAAIRAIFGLVDKFLVSGVIGVIALLLTRRNQRLGDLVANTLVLRERSGLRAPLATSFGAPAGLEAYVATLDVAGLGHDEYATIRSFLLRANTLPPRVRDELGRQVASSFVERLRTVPPAGLPAELFLVCVAAAYQARARPARRVPVFASVWAEDEVAAGRGAATVTWTDGWANERPASSPPGSGPAPGGPAPGGPARATHDDANGYVAPG
jgi:uncharacterized RDD family membrane protein YckC